MNAQKTALVVDDDTAIAEYIARILKQIGYEPTTCSAIEEALELMPLTTADIVVTDIFMRGMGGIEGIRKIRDTYPQTKILAMSGGWGGSDVNGAINAAQKIGADTGIAKPFSKSEFIEAVESVFA